MKPKTKKFLSNFFFGLFSNDHTIEGSKSNPWWVALIIALFSVIIPVIPITVTQAKTYGASFLSGYTYRFDQNIANVTVDLALQDKEFKVEDKLLTYYVGGVKQNIDTTNDGEFIVAHENSSTNQYELLVYYTPRVKKDYTAYIDNLIAVTYKKGTKDRPEDGYEGDLYSPSIVILGSTGIYTRIFKDDSTSIGADTYTGYSTDWKHFPEGSEIIKGALPEGKNAHQVNLKSESDVKEIFNNWKTYYNKSYLTQKTYNVWMTSLLFFGIYVGLVFIMGVLVFVLTRGKNNMFNYLKFIDTQKIVWWSSLSPAILAMIMGFILPNFAQMMFIILLGLRVMWISMKQLRPQY